MRLIGWVWLSLTIALVSACQSLPASPVPANASATPSQVLAATGSGPIPADSRASRPTTAPPAMAWTYQAGGRIARRPLVWKDLVFIISQDNRLHALDLATGQVQWQVSLPAVAHDNSLALGDGRLYLGLTGGTVLVLDAATGSVLWQHNVGADVTFPPTEATGVVYVPTAHAGTRVRANFEGQAALVALDAVTGTRRWSTSTGNFLLTTPLVDGEVVYVAGPFLSDLEEEGGTTGLYALDSATGRVRWRKEVKAGRPKNLTLASGVLQLLGYRDVIYGLSPTDGHELWRRDTGNWVKGFSVAGDTLYFGSATSTVYALNAATGAERWHWQAEGAFNYVIGEPVVRNGAVYFQTTHRQLVALDATTGRRLWQIETGVEATTPPSLADHKLLLAGADGRVIAYRLP